MSGFAWPIAIYERQRAIDEGDKFKLADRELWGLDTMLEHVFAILSRSPAQEGPTVEHAEISRNPLELADMDLHEAGDSPRGKGSLRKRANPI
ncbi:MAG: hypothetical protein V6Z86_04565 [Hyphomicrobiales bacterium]